MTSPSLWEATSPARPPDVPALEEPTTADVVVVGLGASGLTAAVRLAGADRFLTVGGTAPLVSGDRDDDPPGNELRVTSTASLRVTG